MKNYKVVITETLSLEVDVMAENGSDARAKIEAAHKNGDYVLSAPNLEQVNYSARLAEKSRSYQR